MLDFNKTVPYAVSASNREAKKGTILESTNLVEIDRCKVVAMGGSLYLLAPRLLRREGAIAGDEIVYLRAPNSDDTVIRLIKQGSKEE